MQLKGTPDGGKCTFSVANAFEWDTQMYIYMKKYLPVDLIGWERDAMDIKEKCEAEGIWSWTGPKRENGEIVRLSPLQKVYWFPICYGKNFGKSPKKEEEESTKKRNFGGSDWPWAEQSNRFVPCSGRFSPFFFCRMKTRLFSLRLSALLSNWKFLPASGKNVHPTRNFWVRKMPLTCNRAVTFDRGEMRGLVDAVMIFGPTLRPDSRNFSFSSGRMGKKMHPFVFFRRQMGDVDEFFDIFFYNFSTCVMSWCTSWRDPSAFAESLCVDGPFFSDRVAFFFI